MSSGGAQQDIQVSVGKDFVIIGADRIEVSPDGKNVTADAKNGFEVKAASGEATPGISISADFNTVVLHGVTIERAAGGHLVISAPGGIVKQAIPANDTAAKATAHEIGAMESTGEHKGEIYGGIYPADNKPIWFWAAPRLMDHYAAAAWAKEQSGSLPTRKQGNYLTTLKGKGGAFNEIFNRGSSFPAGFVWLAEPNTRSRHHAWCQRLSDGDQFNLILRDTELPVLSVRR